MSFAALLTASAAIAAGYVGARQLLADRAPEQIARLPEGAQGPLFAARRKLVAGRGRARAALEAGRAERDATEAELMREYHRVTKRDEPRP